MDRTDLSGLSDSTIYYFYLNETEYSITTSTSPTYEDVNNLIHSAISGDGYESVIVGTAPNEDIRVKDIARRGSESKVVMDSGTSGPDLFTNLNGFTSLEEPVSGGGGVEQAEYIPIPSGGLTVTGNSFADFIEVIETSSGQILTASSSPADSVEIIESTTGRATAAGTATYTKEITYTGSGQIFTEGIATIYINSDTNTLITDMDGYASISGTATYSYTTA
jgi:hypothetical protein